MHNWTFRLGKKDKRGCIAWECCFTSRKSTLDPQVRSTSQQFITLRHKILQVCKSYYSDNHFNDRKVDSTNTIYIYTCFFEPSALAPSLHQHTNLTATSERTVFFTLCCIVLVHLSLSFNVASQISPKPFIPNEYEHL